MAQAIQISTIDWERASWQEGWTAVEQFTDRLGATVDEGIFEAVVALNLLGFRTFQSCEGHLDHGTLYPWVSVIDTAASGGYYREISRVSELEEEAKRSSTEEAFFFYLVADTALRTGISKWKEEGMLYRRVRKLLDAFYDCQDEIHQPSATRLHVVVQSPGICRIEPGSAIHASELPDHFKATYLAHGRAEMQAFTRFLKSQWQQSQGEA